jgi:integrase
VADPRTEIPPTDLLPRQRSSFQPRIFNQEEIARLLAASLQRRRGAKPISRWSRYAIFGLLSVTGMRVGEALSLDLKDVDLDHGVLTIRNAKFGKSRLVPVHATTCAALKLYLEQREAFLAGRDATPFFVCRWAAGSRIPLACRSDGCAGNSDCEVTRMLRGRVCTICGTAWPLRFCADATALAPTPSVACRRCPRIWGTRISTTPTGICIRTLRS